MGKRALFEIAVATRTCTWTPDEFTFFQAFTAVTLGCDALIARALLRAGARPGGSEAGAWLWVGGLPLLHQLERGVLRVEVADHIVGLIATQCILAALFHIAKPLAARYRAVPAPSKSG